MTEAIAASVERHRGEGFAQRGAAMYAAFASVDDAIAAVNEAIVAPGPTRPRIALDWGDVEIHESGDVTGPPVRRTAGLIAAAHPGQVVLSADAHAALTAADVAGWAAKSLGSHPVYGVDGAQRLYQLLVGGTDTDFPPPRIDANPPALPVDRRAIAGYELRRPISTDLNGTTYAAYQPSVGRQVAITVIDPAWANEADFIRRFEVETQLVTRLQHPHIVPVLDYWRDPTGAYLVMPRVGSTTWRNCSTGAASMTPNNAARWWPSWVPRWRTRTRRESSTAVSRPTQFWSIRRATPTSPVSASSSASRALPGPRRATPHQKLAMVGPSMRRPTCSLWASWPASSWTTSMRWRPGPLRPIPPIGSPLSPS
jgi:hypothetical protein